MKHILLSIALLALPALAEARVATLELSGSDWRIHEDVDGLGSDRGLPTADPADDGWIPATVPGNIQADLEAAHHLTPHWYGAGDDRMFDVAHKDWWYRKDVVIPESYQGRRLTLVFDGVDYDCEVWLNGTKVGGSAGMFRRFTIDVTGVAKPGESNQLAVRIARIPRALEAAVRVDGGWGFSSAMHSSSRVLKDLKSATNWGYDWGVAIYTLGIWKDVRLEATGPARIEWTRVETALSEDHSKATVAVTLEIDSEKALDASVRFRITGPEGKAAEGAVDAPLTAGRNDVRGELVLEHPELWWPAGHGGQPLYTVQADLETVDDGEILDTRQTRFGVREVQWGYTLGAQTNSYSRYQLILNGRPIRTIGSNLLPPDLLFGRMARRADPLLRRARDVGLNILRLWGGGVILHKETYDLADELGIMLMLEVPQANHLPPSTDPVYMANLETTVRSIVKDTRNHPSIIEYNGGNEMPWDSRTENPALQLLQKVVAEEDGRIYRSDCPDFRVGHGPHYFNLRAECRHYDGLRGYFRLGEFGSSSPANLEVWHRTIPPASQWPIIGVDEPVQIRKNIVQAVFKPDYWLRKTFLDEAFGEFDDLPQLIEFGQFYGAEGLRYGVDSLRRKGRHFGGMMSWTFNEPWPNGAGSCQVDYDGRTLMSYDFFKQAVAPVALSLKYDSVFYKVETGVVAELFITSDAPEPATDLQWSWLARDRRGRVLDRGEGSATIHPIESKSLGAIRIKPLPETILGPLFLELRLEDSSGSLLTERIHVFAPGGVRSGFAGLLRNRGTDADDGEAVKALTSTPRQREPSNLTYVGNGASPATASSSRSEAPHQPAGLNDGMYGNQHSWIGLDPESTFQIDLGKASLIGQFRTGRDRSSNRSHDRGLDYLKIETSLDGTSWQLAFEQAGLSALPSFSPAKTLTIEVTPVEARFVRGTVKPAKPRSNSMPCLDEFEVYAPSPEPPGALPWVGVQDLRPDLWRPVTRTTLEVAAAPLRVENGREVLDLTVSNRGAMTALFCQPRPLLDDRGDLFIDNNHCFIPPGESRVIRIRGWRSEVGGRKSEVGLPEPSLGDGQGSRRAEVGLPEPSLGDGQGSQPALRSSQSEAGRSGLTLAQTGWRIACWNADDVIIEPGDEVLLAVGRRDAMCREFAGYGKIDPATGLPDRSSSERRLDPGTVSYSVGPDDVAAFEFNLTQAQARRPARLRIHTADQAAGDPTRVMVSLNGGKMESSLPAGLGIQKTDPSHLAFPASVEFVVDPKNLRPGANRMEVRVDENGWFSWDSMDLISQ